MPRVFVSYRREDSGYVTGRLYEHLARKYSEANVFMDVHTIGLGADFRQTVDDALGKCDVFVPVIGDQWLAVKDKAGNRRLDSVSDYVRIEIEVALKKGIPIIPVLVGDGKMPQADELPPSIRDLAFRNGKLVRPDPDFQRDLEILSEALERHGKHAGPSVKFGAPPKWRPKPFVMIASGLALLLLLVLTVYIIWPPSGWRANTTQSSTTEPTEKRAEVPRPKRGLIVRSVEAGSAADRAGLKRDDILVEIEGKPLSTFESWVDPANTGGRLKFWDHEQRSIRETDIKKIAEEERWGLKLDTMED
jgi:hypothetical protein